MFALFVSYPIELGGKLFKKLIISLSMILSVAIAIGAMTPSYANDEIKALSKQAPKLNPNVIRLALTAYKNAETKGYSHSPILTVIDFALPSNMKRLWVFNIQTNKLLYKTYVAQGKESGLKYAHYFSNQPGTHASSIGLFKTDTTYYGKDGYSLRLIGLENEFNGNASRRDIVVHGAWYVNENYIEQKGYAGHSWGCFAVSTKIVKPLVNTIKNDSLL